MYIEIIFDDAGVAVRLLGVYTSRYQKRHILCHFFHTQQFLCLYMIYIHPYIDDLQSLRDTILSKLWSYIIIALYT